MEWDLVIERNIQLFIRLAGLSEYPLAPCMRWERQQHETWLSYQDGRIYLYQIFLSSPLDEQLLLKAMAHWQPSMFFGIPQRLFQLHRGMVIGCSCPPGSQAEFWLQLHRRQITFLDSQCTPF